ncbi:MAG: ATP-binding cassette domain-containing protein [Dermabacter sp.]|nr:ATP-binding cassette domain-containing protein [Dermabacter sp.]
MPSSGIALELTDFTFTPVGRKRPALDSVSLAVAPGERVLLTGASGAGKSTLLRALAGLVPADAEGSEDAIIQPVPGTALMVQNPTHAFVGAAAGLDMAFAPENESVPARDIPAVVEDARAQAQIAFALEDDPFALSGGQQQRLSLAGVLAATSGALLLDEPLTMLDAATAAEVQTSILEAAASRTLVVADHRAGRWAAHVDRIIHVHPGGVLEERAVVEAAPEATPAPPAPSATTAEAVLSVPARATFEGQTLLAEPVGLSVCPGELVVITGRSGVGKSTYLRHVLESSRSGRSRPYTAAWLPQNPETSFVASSVEREVASGAASPEAARQALADVDLAHLSAANPFAISGGEQRRVAFAAALASGRRVLVLDEPTVGLDPASFAQVLAIIDEARASGVAVIAATHDPDLIAHATRRIELAPHPSREEFAPVRTAPRSPAPPVPEVPRRPRPIPTDALNPLTILAVAACAFAGSLAVRSIEAGLVAVALSLLLIPLTWRTWPRFWLRFVPVCLAGLMIAWSVLLLSGNPWSEESTWRLAASEGMRVFAMVTPGALMMESFEATRLGQALAQKLRFPARPAAAMVAGLSRMGHLFDQWAAILRTRQIRGLYARRPIALYAGATFALLVEVLRGAEVQALAMDARGFTRAQSRTWTHPSRFTGHDVWGAGIALAVLTLPVLATLVL